MPEPSLSPTRNGLYLFAINVCLELGFSVMMGVLWLDPVGITRFARPWMVVMLFSFGAIGLCYRFGAMLPSSHSLGRVFQVCVIGLVPVFLGMGYGGIVTESVGCGGTEGTVVVLGIGAVLGETLSVFCGNVFGYRKTLGISG